MNSTATTSATRIRTAARDYQLFIDGRWVEAAEGGRRAVDRTDGTPWCTVPVGTQEDVDRAVIAARRAFDVGPWPQMSGKERAAALRRLASLIRRDEGQLAEVETLGNNRLMSDMRAQLRIIPDWFEYFAGAADKLHGEVIPTDKPNFHVYTVPEPIGVVAGIVAWNAPLLLATFKMAPALAAGCTFVLKPASQTPVSALEFARIVDEAQFPSGVFNVVVGTGDAVGAPLAGHLGVDKVAFTGSAQAGAEVARRAADHVIPTSLELGGKSPNIVFADADIEAAVEGAMAAIFAASGQTCLAGSRLLVERSIEKQFLERLVARVKKIRIGDPMDTASEMGPLVSDRQAVAVMDFVDDARSRGAHVLCGGRRSGMTVQPTILVDVPRDAPAFTSEIFGPVVCVLAFAGEGEAIELANDDRHGLAAGIWTRDVARAHRVAAQLRVGTVWINSYRTLHPQVPFGGFKMSGYGRENGLEGLRQFTATKSVWVEIGDAERNPFDLG